ncbi:hypothetical protein J2W18_004687 [Rhodococcus cercidiphylli]|nr:hypothetical protein [Rhodococcus cercidiphylli]
MLSKYYPALTGKAGELTALRHTPSAERDVLIPIVTLPVTEDFDEAETASEILKFTNKITTHWDTKHRFIVDASATDGISASGQLAVADLHNQLRNVGAIAVPAVNTGSSPSFLASVATIAATDGHGACIRLSDEDITDFTGLPASLSALLAAIGQAPTEIDLVLDVGFVEAGSVSAFSALVPLIIPMLPNLIQWRSLVLLSGAFPENLASLTPYVPSTFARHDAELWRRVSVLTTTSRVPEFGDYATSHPVTATVTGPWRSAPNIRYADNLSWIALKTNLDRVAGNSTFFDICDQLLHTSTSPMRPATFSWGDGEFHRCASHTGGPGNGTSWKAWSTSHHISTVIDRLATTGVP